MPLALAHSMPPIIPGAWSSSWTVDSLEEQDDMDADKTPRLADCQASYSGLLQGQGSEKADLAFAGTPGLKGRSVSVEEAAHIDGDGDEDAVSLADDDSSAPSEDFYSIISHEDTESTLFPSVILSTSPLASDKDHSDGPLDAPDFAGSPLDASALSPSLHAASHMDVCAPGGRSSDASMIRAAAAFVEDVRRPVALPDISARGQVDAAATYTSLSRGMSRLGADACVSPWDGGPEVTSLRLSQPDGDNPWTLSLDPTLTSTESDASLAPSDNESASVMSRDTPPSMASFRRPSSPYQEEIVFTPQGPPSSAYGAPLEPRTIPGPSPLTYGHSSDSVRSKSFLHKTKQLCRKFKKLVSLKAIKERSNDAKERSAIRHTPLINQVENNMPSTFTSFGKQRAFQAAAKTSASAALSYTPDYTVSRSSNHVSDEMYTYGYHARPKTLREIRSSRRFSLPAFARPSSLIPIARNAGPSSNLQRTGSMLFAEGGMTC